MRIYNWLKVCSLPRATTRLNTESLEDRTVPSGMEFRSYDGTGNNLTHTDWGSAGTEFLRIAQAEYGDGISTPAGADRPSAREISNAVADQSEDILSNRNLSAMIYAWGQFLDHDLTLTNTSASAGSFSIPVPTGDPYFDPLGTGTKTIDSSRSVFDPDTGTTTPRQQVNALSAWIDGSQIYGSDADTASKLRTHSGGRMKMQADGSLPFNNATWFPEGTVFMANTFQHGTNDQMYAAGDMRANENPELLSLHTIFVREHNRVAEQIARQNPGMSDEQIYQRARAVVIAELQSITYNEWLPAVLGRDAVSRYTGYDPTVNPNIANEFATAGFRLGHSMLGDDIEFLDANGNPIAEEVSLAEAFFNPGLLTQNGAESILKYLASDPSSEIDTQIVGSVRNFLFGPPGAGGLDLASLNIERGRDHGLADYNDMRAAYGLPKVTDFSQITSNVELQEKLQSLYGTVNNIDAWVGALAEDHTPGGSTGALVKRILQDQFERLRDGDRFWYQKTFHGKQLKEIENTTLSDLIKRNSSLQNIQNNVFFFEVQIRGTVFADGNKNGRQDPSERGVAGRIVELINAEDMSVIDTVRTNERGEYVFTVQDGVRLGRYLIHEVTPQGVRLTTAPMPTVVLTRGDMFATVNFGEAVQLPTQPPTVPPPKPPAPPMAPPPHQQGQKPESPKPQTPSMTPPPKSELSQLDLQQSPPQENKAPPRRR